MPGEQIQNVISVGMLSEGWDAKTVTHIMGLRAFSSQLLCEQVVGRGLRRTTYETYKTADGKEMFSPEYVNVFGVPFTFMPHEGDDETEPPPPDPPTVVKPLRERRQFQIDWPNFIRVDHVYRPQLTIDLAKVPVLTLNAMDIATIAELAPVLEGKPDLTRLTEINFQDLAREYRQQKIIFEVARDQFDLIKPTWPASRESLLAQLIRLVEMVLQSDRIRIQPELFGHDSLRRRVVLTLSMTRVVQQIWEAIRFQNTEALEPVYDRERPIRSTADMPTWFTRRPNELTKRSHINRCVYASTWEASEAFELDRNDGVAAWAKNDHLGFEVLYVFDGVVRKFRPDFLIRLTNGKLLVLEIKGEDTQQSRTKRRFLDEWVQAVNQQGGFGRWAWDVSFNPADLPDILARHSEARTQR
jgi:type III restriction enzyme